MLIGYIIPPDQSAEGPPVRGGLDPPVQMGQSDTHGRLEEKRRFHVVG